MSHVGRSYKGMLAHARSLMAVGCVQLDILRLAVTATINSEQAPSCLPRIQTQLPSLVSWYHHMTPVDSKQKNRPSSFSSSCHRDRRYSSLAENLTITPAIESRLQHICDRHASLVQQLGAPGDALPLTHVELSKLNKEASDLEDVVVMVEAWRKAKQEVAELNAMCTDAAEDDAMRELAEEERSAAEARLPELERSLLLSLLPQDAVDDRGIVLEVRAGTGGDEACLFAADLFRMYERYAGLRGWKFEPVEFATSDLGGCKQASAAVSGSGVYRRLKFESGVHRVQRVPATETSGRVHTSAASVVVLPQAEDVDVEVRDEDLRIDVYRAGGAGGQHVNTTNSAVRMTHLPTGISVAIQDERSQHKNKAKALKVLRARLYDAERRRSSVAASSARRAQIGSGDRSERVRTYNFPQGRVTDHRVGVTEHGMTAVLAGEKLDSFLDALMVQHQADLLASLDE